MFHWIRSTPRLLDTSLLHVDTTVSQNVYAHMPYAIVFCSKKKDFIFQKLLGFLFANIDNLYSFQQQPPCIAICKKVKAAENILIIFSRFKVEHIFHRAKSIEKNTEKRYILA